jgi:tRNA(Ile)-lysidine synthase
MSDALATRLEHVLADLPPGALVVGFSGGLDSGVLLHVLSRCAAARARGLRAVHVHHGLHPDADAWATHCAAVCQSLSVPLEVVRVAVDTASGLGIEAAARNARHAALAVAVDGGGIVALAHHAGDQAETFLLRTLRASGSDGLGAMRALRRHGDGWLWRPWLDEPRARLLAHAREHELAWVEDPSNLDEGRDRNFIRHQVLPLLRTRWPGAESALCGSARLHREDVHLLEQGDADALAAAATVAADTLRVAPLQSLPAARQARVMRRWVRALGLPPLPREAALRICRELLRDDPALAEFAWAGARVLRWRELLHACPAASPLPRGWTTDWQGTAPLLLPTGGRIALLGPAGPPPGGAPAERGATGVAPSPLRLEWPLRVHARQGGERITLPGRSHSHALKHVLQDLGIPPWERAMMPLLSDAHGTLHAVADVVRSAALEQWLQGCGARLCWHRQPA